MSKEWIKAAAIRAVKTFCQIILSMVGVGACISDINIKYVLSCAVVAAVLSLCTSVVGLPEVSDEQTSTLE